MADQELSFVNCPSCGSLIPSTAIRCRMCGFDMSQDRDSAAEDDSTMGRGRVKQKTLSLTKDEVEDMKHTNAERREPDNFYRPELQSKDNAEPREREGVNSQASVSLQSRTAGYQRGAERSASTEQSNSDDGPAEESRGFRFRGREKDSVFVEPAPHPIAGRVPPERQDRNFVERSEQAERQPERAPNQERNSQPSVQGTNSRNESGRQRDPERREPENQRERQVRQEPRQERRDDRPQERGNQERSGGDRPVDRNRGDRGNRNAESPMHEKGAEDIPHQAAKPQAQASSQVSQSMGAQGSPSANVQQGVAQDSGVKQQQRRQEEQPSQKQSSQNVAPPSSGVSSGQSTGGQKVGGQRQQGPSSQVNSQAKDRKDDKGVVTMQGGLDRNSGRLVGWFLHYQGKQAEPVEIYAGKFLITGAKLRETDLVVMDASLSAPHAIINSAAEDLVMLDLMSEKGTYVKRSGQSDFVQIGEQVTLGHGDWIRFGDYEILICLVPKFEQNT